MRKLSPTIAAVLLAGVVCAPVALADSASAAPCPPGQQPGSPVPAPATPPTPAGVLVGTVLGQLSGDEC